MRLKITIFIAGMLTSLMGLAIFQAITDPYSRFIQFGSDERATRFMKFLDNKGIMYSYTVDHLKRLWIRPHISSEGDYDLVVAEFENIDETN